MEDDLNLDMSKTYIYEGNEYILTGRVANKPVEEEVEPRTRRSNRRPSTPRKPSKNDVVVEIKPAPKKQSGMPNMGAAFGSKWVNYGELYMVTDILNDEDQDEDESNTSV